MLSKVVAYGGFCALGFLLYLRTVTAVCCNKCVLIDMKKKPLKNPQWKQVVRLLDEQVDQESILTVLTILLTAEEFDAVGARLAIMRALLAGEETQREVATRLGVSIAKVTRCSNYLKRLKSTEVQFIKG